MTAAITVSGRVTLDLSAWRPQHGLPALRSLLAPLVECPRGAEVIVMVADIVLPLRDPICWPLPLTLPAGLRLVVEGPDPAVVREVVDRLRFAVEALTAEGVAA